MAKLLLAASAAITSFASTNHAFSLSAAALASPLSSGSPSSLRLSMASFEELTFIYSVSRIIRREGYATSNNPTILNPHKAAAMVGVEPARDGATKETWQRAWKLHRFMMTKVLHRFDRCRPKDSKLSLACLWWKALAGNDITSPVYDHQMSYDLLPPITRWLVSRRLCRWYPRLHHANVEIRTSYLDKSVTRIINTIVGNATNPRRKAQIRLIVMGGGYDTRCMKLLERSSNDLFHQTVNCGQQHKFWKRLQSDHSDELSQYNDKYNLECFELDLPEVVHAKRQLIQTRLHRRRPWLQQVAPTLIPVDFNNVDETRNALESILLKPSSPCGHVESRDIVTGVTTNIFLFEGVMIYLDEGIPHSLLRLCSDVLSESIKLNTSERASSSSGYLCFADRLENVPGGDEDLAQVEMESTGWELLDWLPKPGLARHMGLARLQTERRVGILSNN